MEDYKVYVHIDPEGKRYYGATKLDVNRRWKNGKNYKRHPRFWKAIEKHGWNNIQHIIIAKGLTKEEAYWLEEELIVAWDTTNPDKGYNIAKGGKGPNGVTRSEETRKKMSDNHWDSSGKNNPMAKSVICLTTKRIFYSASEGANYYGIKSSSNITSCCQGKNYKSAGKFNGQKLVWRYLVWEHNKKFRNSINSKLI